MRFNSIRFKTNVLYTAILGVILLIYSGTLFYAVRTILYRDLDESLKVKAKEVGDILHAYEQTQMVENHPRNFLVEIFKDERAISDKMVIDELWHSELKTLNLKNDYIHILTFKKRLVLTSENVKADVAALFSSDFPPTIDRTVFKDLKDKDHYLRVINLPFLYNNRPWLIIQIGTPLASVTHTLDKLTGFMVVAVVFVLVLTSSLGSILAKSVLVPVKQITETADNISYRDLHVRIEEGQTDEEIRNLVRSFNSMLTRLERSFEHINEFSSHVAHELKTPLAILRGEMELALNETQTAAEYKKVLETGMEEVNRLIKIIKDLLLLANLDYRTDIFKFEKLDLGGFLNEIFENGKILAAEKNIAVTSEIPRSELYVEGDKVHLRRLFFNLFNNAVKFTPRDGKIHIALTTKDKKALISVADTGIGIAGDDLAKIFTKFFRVKKEQSPELSSGLGLSIAQAIAKAHQGEISVQSEVGKGSVFTVTFPLV